MKRFVLVALVCAAAACAVLIRPGVLLVNAQTLPAVKTLSWDPNPVGDAVTNYVVTLDGVTIGSPTVPSQSVTFTTVGAHTITLVAVNVWGSGSPATLAVTVVVPAKPVNMRLQ